MLRFLRRRSDEDFAREIDAHVALEIDEQIARGVQPDEARAAAQRALGNATRLREDFHERSPWFAFDTLQQDVRYGLRSLRRAPLVTLVAIGSLALGIGANTAIFTLVKATVLQPLAIPQPERVFVVYRSAGEARRGDFHYSEFLRLRDGVSDLATLAGYGSWGGPIEFENEKTSGGFAIVTNELFEVLALPPLIGRWPTVDEERKRAQVAVIGARFWREALHADPSVLGRAIRLNGQPYVIVGVAPERLGLSAESGGSVVVPVTTMPALVTDMPMDWLDEARLASAGGSPERSWLSPVSWLSVAARLRPGVTPEMLEARLRAIDPARDSRVPGGAPGDSLVLVPARDAALPFASRAAVLRFLMLLSSTVALVLLIGCANLALVILARGEERRREMSVRVTLGASRWRLTRQLLTESLILAIAGGATGLVLSRVLLRALAIFSLPGDVAVAGLALTPDAGVLAFAGLVSVLTALLFGLTPAWHSTSISPISTLKTMGAASGGGRSVVRSLLLGCEVALATVLLVGAGLFVRSVEQGLRADLGYDTGQIILARTELDPRSFDGPRRQAFTERLLARVRQLPGVDAAGLGPSPFSPQGSTTRPVVEGRVFELRNESVQFLHVDPGYRAALGLPLLEGRDLTPRDVPLAGAKTRPPRVALVNQAFVERFLQGRRPIGRRFEPSFRGFDEKDPTVEIVGVVARSRFQELRERNVAAAYTPMEWEQPTSGATLVVRASRRSEELMATVAREIRLLNPDAPPPALTTIHEQLGRMLRPERLGARLLGWFSGLALLLALLGTYGMVSYAVSRRTTEIGIRLALGATPRRVMGQMVRIGLAPVLLGVVVGCTTAWHVTALAQQFLFEISPRDAVSFVGAALLLVVAGAIAAWLPARRAARIEPAEALRAE